MKLEHGKRYVTRGGEIVGPMIEHPGSFCNERRIWWPDGSYFSDEASEFDIVREYAEQDRIIAEPARPTPAMQTRIIKMAVMPKGEPTYSENTTMIEIDEFPGGAVLLVSQDHDDPEIQGKVAISPEEWPAIKAAIETMLGYIEEAEEVENE